MPRDAPTHRDNFPHFASQAGLVAHRPADSASPTVATAFAAVGEAGHRHRPAARRVGETSHPWRLIHASSSVPGSFQLCDFFDAVLTDCRMVGSTFDRCTFTGIEVAGGDWSTADL
jgi:hypothetical protein